jgi:hypothetical protein
MSRRVCEGCGVEWEVSQAHHGKRYHDMACYLAAPRPERPSLPRVAPTPEAVRVEMQAAYDVVVRHVLEEGR